MNKIKKYFYLIFEALSYKNYKVYPFIQGHNYLSKEHLLKLKKLLYKEDEAQIKEFESLFASHVGSGQCISYASGRMGFFALLEQLKITKNDEVIILGFTCSVMVNAILRVGAKPIYSDIDKKTLGSSLESIKLKCNPKTKMIVAQHSFGIPCEIEEIANFAKSNNIFLLEDCALAFGSSVNNVNVGNFGNAALFSSDHSKPINTILGGLLYSNNLQLIDKLRKASKKNNFFSIYKKQAIYKQFLLEMRFLNPDKFYLFLIFSKIQLIFMKLGQESPFLLDDSSLPADQSYPYPAKLPSFLAYLGILELQRWGESSAKREQYLKDYLNLIAKLKLKNKVPKAYFNSSLKIIPLRLIFFKNPNLHSEKYLSNFINIDQIWFKLPIISTKVPLDLFFYSKNSCKFSEEVGSKIVNFPSNLDNKHQKELMFKIKKYLS
ncbi:MAG: DegT/DnrJ/EryC1/StrS aminotransferase family protein [Methylophilaceae bacterium]|nr:DegT/DnrJ/EryC1/StrS aminotransferase family protein [Methylophilaceae bacterium]